MDKIKELRTLRHRLLSLEHNLVGLGIECTELRTLDTTILGKIALRSAGKQLDLGDFDE